MTGETYHSREPQQTNSKLETTSISQFGERLDYSKPEYKDVWAMALFYFMCTVMVGFVGYFWYQNRELVIETLRFIGSYKIFMLLIGCYGIAVIVGIAFAIFWMKIMNWYVVNFFFYLYINLLII